MRAAHNNMFALWPGDWLNFSNFKQQRLVSWDNARLRKPATSQTQTLCASLAPDYKRKIKLAKTVPITRANC
jgi:hypothetical protein